MEGDKVPILLGDGYRRKLNRKNSEGKRHGKTVTVMTTVTVLLTNQVIIRVCGYQRKMEFQRREIYGYRKQRNPRGGKLRTLFYL